MPDSAGSREGTTPASGEAHDQSIDKNWEGIAVFALFYHQGCQIVALHFTRLHFLLISITFILHFRLLSINVIIAGNVAVNHFSLHYIKLVGRR